MLAKRNGWGEKKFAALEEALSNLIVVDINHPMVIDGYVEIDLASQAHPDGARNMGKNDLWIAAAAKAAGATLLTTDKDFNHLIGDHLDGEVVDPTMIGAPHGVDNCYLIECVCPPTDDTQRPATTDSRRWAGYREATARPSR